MEKTHVLKEIMVNLASNMMSESSQPCGFTARPGTIGNLSTSTLTAAFVLVGAWCLS